MKKLEETFSASCAQDEGGRSRGNGEPGEMHVNCNAHKPQILKGLQAVLEPVYRCSPINSLGSKVGKFSLLGVNSCEKQGTCPHALKH